MKSARQQRIERALAKSSGSCGHLFRLRRSPGLRAVTLGLLLADVACRKPEPPRTTGPDAGASVAPRHAASPPAPGRVLGPTRVQLRVGYMTDERMSSDLEVDRSGAYILNMEGDDGSGTIHRRVCDGVLALSTRDDLWRAIDAASFAPATEPGFDRPIQAPRGKAGQQGRYTVHRLDGDGGAPASPANEGVARALIGPARTAIDAAETQAERSPSSCQASPSPGDERRSRWVSSAPGDSVLDTKVDIGSLEQIGDAIEATLRFPPAPGILLGMRTAEPSIDIPDGTATVERDRVVCTKEGLLWYTIDERWVAPDGRVLRRRQMDPAEARRKAEASLPRSNGRSSYASDPRSLVCWAAARTCAGEPFTWPPPPNLAPLEHSPEADRMRADHNARFVPRCALPR
jgi:hypothetical protein